MTVEQAKVIVAAKDISTVDKRNEFLAALKLLSANAFIRQN